MNTEQTKKCRECQTDIPKKARRCPNCRTKQGIGLGGLIVVIMFIGITSSVVMSSVSDTSPRQSEITVQVIDGSKTYITAQSYIKQMLKSPSTADFPFLDYGYTKHDEDTHSVSAYVDSQNSFGATVRSKWFVTLTHNGGDWSNSNNWTLERLVFDGETIFESEDAPIVE